MRLEFSLAWTTTVVTTLAPALTAPAATTTAIVAAWLVLSVAFLIFWRFGHVITHVAERGTVVALRHTRGRWKDPKIFGACGAVLFSRPGGRAGADELLSAGHERIFYYFR